jgi:hypothetical protein
MWQTGNTRFCTRFLAVDIRREADRSRQVGVLRVLLQVVAGLVHGAGAGDDDAQAALGRQVEHLVDEVVVQVVSAPVVARVRRLGLAVKGDVGDGQVEAVDRLGGILERFVLDGRLAVELPGDPGADVVQLDAVQGGPVLQLQGDGAEENAVGPCRRVEDHAVLEAEALRQFSHEPRHRDRGIVRRHGGGSGICPLVLRQFVLDDLVPLLPYP